MAGETKSLGVKEKNDKFYTKTEVVKKCCDSFDFSKYKTIIEPSAGNGAFLPFLPYYKAYDIAPENENIIQQDFLKLQENFIPPILVIGNPPFGQQGKMAIDFFNYAANFADEIGFILPLSFKKDSMKNRLNLNFHLIKEIILEENSFTLNNNDYSVPCVFQIWEKQPEKRLKKHLKTTTSLFDFVTAKDADFRIQRVGGNAGKASLDLDKSSSSNYFIKNKSSFSIDYLIQTINKMDFPSINWTVGPKSLSKGELIECLEQKFEANKN